MKLSFAFSILLAAAAAAAFADDADIIAPGAELEKLAGDFRFTEGPSIDAEGNTFFTDQPNDRILKWSPDGKLSTFLQPAGRSNGLCFDAEGALWACADDRNELWKIDVSTGKHEVILRGNDGMTIDERGNVYLTGKGVQVYNPAGEKIAQIDVPEKWTANICFGGADRNLLFITASESVYGLKMTVRGASSQ